MVKRSFFYLNCAQSLGVFNDILLKFTLLYLLFSLTEDKALTLSLAGALFVLPYLFFSSLAGKMADLFPKKTLFVYIKCAEILTLTASFFVFFFQSYLGALFILFLFALIGTCTLPVKHGMVPEIVSKESIVKANGITTSSGCFFLILGTFLSSFVKDYRFIHSIALFMAILALVSVIKIEKKEAQPQEKSSSTTSFFKELYLNFKYAKTEKNLLLALFASSFFFLINSFVQLSALPLSEAIGIESTNSGYLFLFLALGISVSSFLLTKKKRTSLKLSCIASFFVGPLLLLFNPLIWHIPSICLLLFLIGFCGGLFIVPITTHIQIHSSARKRGSMISLETFFDYLSVLFSSFLIYLFGDILRLKAHISFSLMGILSLTITLIFALCLSKKEEQA